MRTTSTVIISEKISGLPYPLHLYAVRCKGLAFLTWRVQMQEYSQNKAHCVQSSLKFTMSKPFMATGLEQVNVSCVGLAFKCHWFY